jgi:hypothetical protein
MVPSIHGLQGVKKSTASRKDARAQRPARKNPFVLLGDLCDFAPLREIFFGFPTISSHLLAPWARLWHSFGAELCCELRLQDTRLSFAQGP